MKKLAKFLTPCVVIFSCFFALGSQKVVQTPAQEITTDITWPQVTTALFVAGLSFAGIIMWQWVRKRR